MKTLDIIKPIRGSLKHLTTAVKITAGLACCLASQAQAQWTYSPWTGDADSGITSASAYTVAVNCSGAATTVNGVPFEASATSGANFSIGGGIAGWGPGAGMNITGDSLALASTFIWGGNPRTITLTNLTVGATYETSLFAFGFDASPTIRSQTFAAGSDSLVLDQNFYGQNNGIRIAYTFVADSTGTKELTITPDADNSFHMSALANRQVVTTLTVDLTNPADAEAIESGTLITATATVVEPGAFTNTVTFHTTPISPAGPTVQTVSSDVASPFSADLGTLPAGSYEIYATTVNTDDPVGTATSATRTFTVAAATPTTTVLAAAGPATTYGENVTFTATVDPVPTGGTVQFSDGITYLGGPVAVNTTTGEASVSTTTLVAGTHAITAEYSGYQIFGASTTVASISHEVGKAPLTVKASSYTRPPNALDPNPLPSAILGFVNGERLTTSGVTGTPALTTAANLASPVGPYTITCAVGTLAADNYSFTPENGTLTVAVPAPTTLIYGGDFEMYKPGTLYYVPAAFTDDASYASGVGDGKSVSGGTVTYSDGSIGYADDEIADFDLPGWAPLQSGNDLLNNGVGGSTGCNIFAAWGGDGRIQTTGSLLTITVGQTITITAMVNGGDGSPIGEPLAFHLLADGVQLVPTSFVDPAPPFEAFQMISRTYSAAVLAPHLGKPTTIVLGVEDINGAGGRVVFDDVKLETTSAPAGYGTWAAANAGGQTASEDFDNDGVDNGIEYFMGQTGSSFTANPSLNASNAISWPASAAYDGTYEVQTSPDLATWTNVVPKPVPSGGTLSYTLPTGLGKRFVRLLVTPTP